MTAAAPGCGVIFPDKTLPALESAAHFLRRALSRGLSSVLIFLIRAYQSVHGAFFRGSCRFHPTCSHYALEAIERHGAGRGTVLTAWRVLRCQPFCRGGFDPVPEPKSTQRKPVESRCFESTSTLIAGN